MRKKERIYIEGGVRVIEVDKIPEIIKKIEDNVGVQVLPDGKIRFMSFGGKRYLKVNK